MKDFPFIFVLAVFLSCTTPQVLCGTLSSAGIKFVVGFPRNAGSGEQLLFFLTNPDPIVVNFTVNPIDIKGSISVSSTSVIIPSNFEVLSVNERNKGILVEADGNINLYGLSFHSETSDAYLALPCTVMAVDEYEYYGISYDALDSSPIVILLVACENETVVKFDSSTITLNSMETYQIESGNDLTGTRITSSKPLSVISGSECANVPQGILYCDHLVEQVPPTVTWGSKFLVASLKGRSSGERIRVLSVRAASVAVNCNTVVSVSEFQLQSGGSFREFEIPINSFCSIESTSPVLVTQYAFGSEIDDNGDPFMMIIPPIEQFTNNYLVEVLPDYDFNYVTMYVSSEFFQTAQILLDDFVVTDWQNVTCSSGEVCGHISRTDVSTGGALSIRHQNSSAVLGVSVYGFTIDNSYGYPGGMRLSPIQCNCGQNFTCLNNMGQFNCSCLNGFGSLSGIDEVICNPITCPPLPATTNGCVIYSSTADENNNYAFDVVATYRCDTGFSLIGNSSRTCTGDGSSIMGAFDGLAPSCEANPPIITSDPSDLLLVVEGMTVQFSVTAEGANLAYQWMNGDGDLSDILGKISGATMETLMIMNVSLSDVSDYSVRVSNSDGDVNSSIANLITTSSYQVTLGNSSPLESIESSQASILYRANLSRINGVEIQQLPTAVKVTLVAKGTPSNTVSGEGVDFSIGPLLVTFGPCDPCTPDNLQREAQLCVKDDEDLEFDHGFTLSVDLASTDPLGITAGDPLLITITDDEQSTVGVTFDQADYTVAENSSLTVTGRLTGLTGELQSDFSLTLSVILLSVTSSDVTFNTSDLIINFDAFENTTFSLTIDANNDDDFEGFHSFVISLPTDSDYINPLASDTASTTITISDFDDATVSVSTAVVTGEEGTNITVCASVMNASSDPVNADIIELSFELVPDTADASDYASVGRLFVNFTGSPGIIGSEDCVTVSLLEDDILESDQQFLAILSSVNARVDVSETVIVITNTNIPTLNFLSGDLTVLEGEDIFIFYPLQITDVPAGGLEGLIEYELIVSPSGATVNVDYRADNPSIVSFGSPGEITSRAELEGALSTTAQIEILDNIILDTDNENMMVFLLAPDNSRSKNIIIVDNERAVVSFDAVSYAGTEGLSDVSLVLNLTDIPAGGFQDNTLTVTLTIINQGKTNASDYSVPVPFRVTFLSLTPPFAVSDPVVITAVTDNLFEDTETLQVIISDISSLYVVCTACTADLSFQQAAADIPSWSFDRTATSGSEGSSVDVCATLSGIPSNGLECDIVLQLTAMPGAMNQATAVKGVDFEPDNMEFSIVFDTSITESTASRCAAIDFIDDDILESSEFLTVTVSSVTPSIVIGDTSQSVEVQINDTDAETCELSFVSLSYTVSEDVGSVDVCVRIAGLPSGGLAAHLAVELVFMDSTKTSINDDYDPSSTSVVFEAGLTGDGCIQCLSIAIVNDTVYEGDDQRFSVMGGNVGLGCVFSADNTATVYITENPEDVPSVSLDSDQLIVMESDEVASVCATISNVPGGGLDCPIILFLSAALGKNFKPAMNGMDYSPPGDFQIEFGSSSLSGDSECVNVTIINDDFVEDREEFVVTVTNVTPQMELSGSYSVAVIIVDNDSAMASFSPGSVIVTESDFVNSSVCVVLTSLPAGGALECDIDITLTPLQDTAVLNEDFEYFETVLMIPAGTALNQPVCVYELQFGIVDDQIVEDYQSFSIVSSSVSPANTLIVSGSFTVTIQDNDYANVSLSLDAYNVLESDGNVSVCAVLLEGELAREVAVNITTTDTVGTAAAGSDYTSLTDYTLSFVPGSPVNSMSCVDIVILEDSAVEDIERFYVELSTSDPVNILSPENASVSILDDDVLGVGLVSSSFTVTEIDGYLTVGVEIQEGSLESEQSVLILTQAGTATPALDYEEILSMMLILPSGLGVGDIVYFNVSILNDEAVEELFENFTVHLNDTARVSIIGTRYAVVDIEEDETDVVMVTFGLAEVIVNEDDKGSVCVNVTGQLERQVSISVSISGGSASTGLDHDFPAFTLFSFSSSPDTYYISFKPTQDAIYETDETISVRLDSSDPQVITGAISTISILDNDEVELQLVVVNVCESDGPATVCVQLRTDTEREATATVQTSDLSALNGLDYITSTLTFSFPNPSPADTMQCGSVPIMSDTIVEPCEAFYLNLTSSAERNRIVDDDLSNTVIIYDDEDVDDFLLFNNSPQIVGRSLTVDYTISGCAQVLCQVTARTAEFDCSPPTGSLTGQWYQESVTARKTINKLVLTAVPRCPSQVVPSGFEERNFRIDNTQCSVVFTDQQYEVDPVSGDVTVEWAGTGPTAEVNVSEFTCRLPNGTSTDCTSPFVLTGLAQGGNHTFSVIPHQISNSSMPQCASRRGLIGAVLVIRL